MNAQQQIVAEAARQAARALHHINAALRELDGARQAIDPITATVNHFTPEGRTLTQLALGLVRARTHAVQCVADIPDAVWELLLDDHFVGAAEARAALAYDSGQGGGNLRYKAKLESYCNLAQNDKPSGAECLLHEAVGA